MIVAAHQPNFLPWLGFFEKMRRADVFVVVDHVQFERHNFQNRTRVKASNGPLWITVPVLQRSRDERIVDKEIDNSKEGAHRWSRKMSLTLRNVYAGAPHSADYVRAVTDVLDADWKSLVDLNLALIELCRGFLGIKTPLLRSSRLGVQGAKSEMVLDLCRRAGGDVYLSGTGGCKDYLDLPALERGGVRVQWQDFVHPVYPQRPRGQGFVEKLSVVDLLVNCGPRSGEVLRSDAPTAPRALEAPRAETPRAYL